MDRYNVLRFCIPIMGGLMFPLVVFFDNPIISLGIIMGILLISFAFHLVLKIHKIKYEDLERAEKCICYELGFLMLDKEGFSISVINRETKLNVITLLKRCFFSSCENYSVYTSMGEVKVSVMIYDEIAFIDEMDFISNVNYEELLKVS
ncbi:hypothetical protein P7D15_01840 [Bacillus cereus]|uniref:hypothetical protein n=1 Tax=Bacillus cereus TaxID=1396 RepID=UPI002405A310|nr:hypothetical protein [Bacillus cereus]MCU5282105.1 hypothetical protein [Bacillus cereus]MDF9599158.1 hypothetical protein [Bacillus cereus]MDG1589491.1 hypothetical protein [Bacillus cereus]